MKFRKVSDIYFVGIGGIGMSGIAELLHNLNFNISGSDMSDNENVKRLQKLGINITIGHSKTNIKNDRVDRARRLRALSKSHTG